MVTVASSDTSSVLDMRVAAPLRGRSAVWGSGFGGSYATRRGSMRRHHAVTCVRVAPRPICIARAAHPGVSGRASAGLSVPLLASEASGAPRAGSRLPGARRVEACPPRHGRASRAARDYRHDRRIVSIYLEASGCGTAHAHPYGPPKSIALGDALHPPLIHWVLPTGRQCG